MKALIAALVLVSSTAMAESKYIEPGTRFCGPGSNPKNKVLAPKTDEACKKHDCEYGKIECKNGFKSAIFHPSFTVKADAALTKDLLFVIASPFTGALDKMIAWSVLEKWIALQALRWVAEVAITNYNVTVCTINQLEKELQKAATSAKAAIAKKLEKAKADLAKLTQAANEACKKVKAGCYK